MNRLYTLAVLPLVFLALGMADDNRTHVELTSPFTTSESFRACGHCHLCEESFALPGHDFHAASPSEKDGFDHECYGGLSCDDYHPSCLASAATKNDAGVSVAIHPADVETGRILFRLAAIRDQDKNAVLALIDEYPARLQINSRRGVLQLSAPCSKDFILAQVPLPQ